MDEFDFYFEDYCSFVEDSMREKEVGAAGYYFPPLTNPSLQWENTYFPPLESGPINVATQQWLEANWVFPTPNPSPFITYESWGFPLHADGYDSDGDGQDFDTPRR